MSHLGCPKRSSHWGFEQRLQDGTKVPFALTSPPLLEIHIAGPVTASPCGALDRFLEGPRRRSLDVQCTHARTHTRPCTRLEPGSLF